MLAAIDTWAPLIAEYSVAPSGKRYWARLVRVERNSSYHVLCDWVAFAELKRLEHWASGYAAQPVEMED